MKKSRLVNLLRSLDESEIDRIEEMVHSPYFNKNKKVTQLFELLRPHAPKFDHPSMSRENIATILYQGKAKTGLSSIISKLQGLVKEHLTREQLDDRPFFKRHLLLKSLLEKGNLSLFLSQYNESILLLKNQSKKSIDSLYDKYLIEDEYRSYLFKKKGRNDATFLPDVILALDAYYLTRKLNLSCELLDLEDIINIEYDPVLLKNIGEVIQHPIYQKNSFVQVFYAVLQMLQNQDNEDYFLHLVDLLKMPISQEIKKPKLNQIYTHAINYCINKIIARKPAYRERLFDLYILIIQNKLIYDETYLNLGRLKNIISLACQLGKTEWAKQFVTSRENEIAPEHRDSAYNYYMASIFFYEKNYEKTTDHLNQIDKDIDQFYYVNTRTLQIRCYYELNLSDLFSSKCDAFKTFLRRNKTLNKAGKSAYNNFIKMAIQLFRKKEGFSKKSIHDLGLKLKKTTPLNHNNWLQEKLEQLHTLSKH